MVGFLRDDAVLEIVEFGSVRPVIVLGACEFPKEILTILGFLDDG